MDMLRDGLIILRVFIVGMKLPKKILREEDCSGLR